MTPMFRQAALPRSLLLLALLAAGPATAASPVAARPGSAGARPGDDPLLVQTSSGPVMGFVEPSSGTAQWLGIPYAEPPVGELRFRPPQPVAAWQEPLNASALGQQCPQFYGVLGAGTFFGAEDCLTVNVYRPDNFSAGAERLPVMAWIYGGGFAVGSSDEYGAYDPEELCQQFNVVVVSFNYRLGALGFLSHRYLLGESGTTGNYGLQDQALALRWAADNAAAFGGDPERLTIFGESAGGFSVCTHLVRPALKGVFSSAIIESGSCDTRELFQPLEQAANTGDWYAQLQGCNSSQLSPGDWLACMRALPVASVLDSVLTQIQPGGVPPQPPGVAVPPFAPVFTFGPCLDGSAEGLLDLPLNLIRQGRFNRVPVLLGTNTNETNLFLPIMYEVMPGLHFPLADADLATVIGHFSNASVAAQAEQLYPQGAFPSPSARIAAAMTDNAFVCPARRAARALSGQGVPVYVYRFAYLNAWPDVELMGDYHSSELPFVFRHQIPLLHQFSAQDVQMSDVFQTYWTQMAAAGTPNGAGGVEWPLFNATSGEQNLVLQLPPVAESGYHDATCDFWDTVVA